MFFIFNVFLLTGDIASDIWNGINLISRGDVYWGSYTLLFSALPFLAQILAVLFDLLDASTKNNLAEKNAQRKKLFECLWFTPVLHPFVSVYILLIKYLLIINKIDF
jgi:hypothetical protein